MFKKREEQKIATNKGSFSQVPNEVMYLVMFFLDVKSLSHLAMTNSTFNELVSNYPTQIYVKICNKEYKGTYSQIHTQFIEYLRIQQAEIVRQKRSEEETAIEKLKNSVKAKKYNISQTWDVPLKKSCITQEEKAAVGCCCTLGLIGGILVSCFTPMPWFLTTSLGMGAGGAMPLVVSRTIRCCCGKCLQCKEHQLATKEENLHKNYPSSPSMKM
ncbi:hypothetical protein OQJ19_08060 [Fluoribacter gormanii]|uniref:F-box domain-containing protein n=1 Tax=Fluoribacter gormanii TaxID=464 RepID=A0A377GP03_9GAMM|nr:F-box protein [Fluoribacter gormanii]KTD04765.1 hypothetical protein Lgor_0847 [Fluoribacter gormanii]MCW8445401.1 hypothetical protein [Fluoribacter gormanii]MCW8470606.1 hypothetical protein [Fluoribacter gormanii]SIR15988.1 hypothetical protein SAMN05421777_10779 [Fluoribacter gormanii]STO26235.1 Uncharacterised protein [Fluoribacter gormanii]